MTTSHWLSGNGPARRLLVALCPAITLALALTQAAASRQPAVARPVWYRQYPPVPGNPVAIACPTPLTCYAAGTGGATLRTADAGDTWRREAVTLPAGFVVRAIACRTDSACVASADDRGGSLRTILLATTDGGQTWRRRHSTPQGGTNGLACPTSGECVALLHGGMVVTGSESTPWREHALPLPTTAMVADGLSCPAPGSCFVDAHENRGDGYGAVLATTDGGASWQTHIIRPGHTHGSFAGISCPDGRTCYVVTNGRSSGVLVTHDAWHTQAYRPLGLTLPPSPAVDNPYFAQPDCPDAETCYLRSSVGVIASTGDGGRTWHEHPLDRADPSLGLSYFLPQGIRSLACPATRRCLAVRTDGNIARTTNGWDSWSTTFLGTARALSAVACTGPSTCLAPGANGTLLGTSDGLTWTRRPYPLPDGRTLLAIACHGLSYCLVTGTGGAVARTQNGGTSWTPSTVRVPGKDELVLRAASCPTATTCYAGGYAYSSSSPGPATPVLFRTASAGATWQRLRLPPRAAGIAVIRCTTTRVCLAGGGDASDDDSYPSGSLLLTRDAGATWRQIGSEAYFGIACIPGGTCEVVGQSRGRAPLALRVTLSGAVRARWQGPVSRFFRQSLESVACAGPHDCYAVGDGGLVAHTRDGAHWTAQALGLTGLAGVTCPDPARCYAVGADSIILSTSSPGSAPEPTATPQGRGPGGSPPTPTLPPAQPIPTEAPAGPGCPPTCAPGMILYRADWTRGLDGWVARGGGTGGWHVKGGALISPAVTYQHPPTYLLPPFQPGAHGVSDYAVELQVRPVSRDVDFHVSLRRQGQRYDDFAMSSCCTNRADVSIIYRDESTRTGYDTIIGDAQLPPLDAQWHTYRLEVRGESLRFIVDSRPLVRGLDRHLLAGGEIDLFGQDVPLMFRRFTIVSL